jgi:hypothetical protein
LSPHALVGRMTSALSYFPRGYGPSNATASQPSSKAAQAIVAAVESHHAAMPRPSVTPTKASRLSSVGRLVIVSALAAGQTLRLTADVFP